MPILDQRIRDLLNANDTLLQQRHCFVLLQNLPALVGPTSDSNEVEQATLSHLLTCVANNPLPRSRCCFGLLVVELLKHLGSTQSQIHQLSEGLKHSIGDIIVAAENEDLKLIAGTILCLSCSERKQLGSFFSSSLAKDFVDVFPLNRNVQWVEEFQHYLEDLERRDLIRESDSTILYATSVFIEGVQFGGPDELALVELLPSSLTITQLSISRAPLVVEIATHNIFHALHSLTSGCKDARETKAAGVAQIVLTLSPTSNNHLVNAERKFAETIKFLPNTSYDEKGFLAALRKHMRARNPHLKSNESLIKGKDQNLQNPIDKVQSDDSSKTAQKAIIAFTSLQEGQETPLSDSPEQDLSLNIRDQMRDEEGESKTSLPRSDASVSQNPSNRKSKSSNTKVNGNKSSSTAQGQAVNRSDDEAEVFDVPSSPAPAQTRLKKPDRKAASAGKRKSSLDGRRRESAKRKSSTSKKRSRPANDGLQMKTRSSIAKEALSNIDQEVDDSRRHENATFDDSHGREEQENGKASTSTKRPRAIAAKKGKARAKVYPMNDSGNPVSAVSNLFTDKSRPELHAGLSASKRADKALRGEVTLLSDRSIRKPSITAFGPHGPSNQGTLSRGSKDSPSNHTAHKSETFKSNLEENDDGDDQSKMRQSVPVDLTEVSSSQPDWVDDKKLRRQGVPLGDIQSPEDAQLDSFIFVEPPDAIATASEKVHSPNVQPQHSSELKTISSGVGHQILGVPSSNVRDTCSPRAAARYKRPLEDVSPTLGWKQLKLGHTAGDSENTSDGVPSPADVQSYVTGSQLSRRVDVNGSPYPKSVRLPINRKSASSWRATISRERTYGSSCEMGIDEETSIQMPPARHETPSLDSTILWCENLPPNITTQNVGNFFGFYGRVESSWLAPRKEYKAGSRHGYVKMSSAAEASSVIEFLDGRVFHDETIRVRKVNERLVLGRGTEFTKPASSVEAESGDGKAFLVDREPSQHKSRQDKSNVENFGGRSGTTSCNKEVSERSASVAHVSAKTCSDTFEEAVTKSQSVPSTREREDHRITTASPSLETARENLKDLTDALLKPASGSKFFKHISTFASLVEPAPSQVAETRWNDSEATIAESEDDNVDELLSDIPTTRSRRDEGARSVAFSSSNSETSSSSPSTDALVVDGNTIERDQALWSKALRPHQESYADAVIQVSRRLLLVLAAKEEGIKEIATGYRTGGLQLVKKLEESRERDVEAVGLGRAKAGRNLSEKLQDLAKAVQSECAHAGELEGGLDKISAEMQRAGDEGPQHNLFSQLLSRFEREETAKKSALTVSGDL